ncbi:uncharacterized protein OCT59_026964 [Rhizophagus irregularis]|uniref:uncharacterized protein n=1 Tax=Rhizophagus irregularis TaxID=588596 RepID=UPI0033283F12|nr:hypothetical protein OCT59_026964 [Rhizophagus irregularis]
MQLKINDYNDTIIEWIQYNQFNDIKELNSTTYSARWKDGPLTYDHAYKIEYTRNSANKTVILKYLIKNITNEFLNETIEYYNKFQIYKIYGISQNPIMKNYIIVLNLDQYFEVFCRKCGNKYTNLWNKWCKVCQKNYLRKYYTNRTSKNEQIDKLIQEMQIKINDYDDALFEWIPYFQFSDIKELSNKTYSAKWKDGPLLCNYYKNQYKRNSESEAVILKYLVNSQNITNESLKETIAYYNKVKIYGISQDPNTKDYIIIFNKLTLNMAGSYSHSIIRTVIILTFFLIKLVYTTIQYHNYYDK